MTNPIVSVVIPTRYRPERLAKTISSVGRQDLPAAEYEIIVVDDGSVPPVTLPEKASIANINLLRLEHCERSAARNAGAMVARGKVLVFLDDDMTVGTDFISNHLSAHRRWPGALVVGSIQLPNETLSKPFARFRQQIENDIVPEVSGPTPIRNFCAAGNMSISRELFQNIGGFNPKIVSGEDQDFALRHSALGRQIVFWPGARAIHRDNALDIRSYCSRTEWGTKNLIEFCRRHPNWPDNIQRERVNSAIRPGGEPVLLSLNKVLKDVLDLTPLRWALFLIASVLERVAAGSLALDRTYRVLLGVHIRRGYREGARLYAGDAGKSRQTAQATAAD